jgi:CO dehydrogenase maturation factor
MNNGIREMNIGIQKRVVAICGKGGVGKTAFTTMMTRALLESAKAGKLLVIDADPALGLPATLGINVERTIGQVRESIIDTAKHGSGVDKTEIANQLDYMVLEALVETDKLALLAMGRTEAQGCFCPVNDILRDSIAVLSNKFDTIVIDGEAGLEQINRQVMSQVDVLIILTDTSTRGRQTVEYIKKLVVDEHVIECKKLGVVFNRVQGGEELLFQSAKNIGIDVFGVIPQDENIANYDLVGRPLSDLPTESPALVAVRHIVERCVLTD